MSLDAQDWNENLNRSISRAAPDSPPEVAGIVVWLSRLARAYESVVARLNEQHGLLRSETGVLMTLWMAGPSSGLRPSFLAEVMEQTTGGMTATLRRLESTAMVERIADPSDGRVSLAKLTDKGQEIGLQSFSAMADWFTQTFEGVDTARREQMLEMVIELFTLVENQRRSDGI
ncbi:MAG: MarR family transcriptional regulator [Actinomycetia bacterium]|nr:MarR family transcriptional regulator [Actinomycetes bacterium]